MKRLFIVTFAVVLVLALFSSCAKDDVSAGKIDIEFQVPTLDIDLNKNTNPPVTCVVTSESGLSSVTMYILREGGIEEQFKTPITTFFNDKVCSVFEKPAYQEDMVGFKVVARDKGGSVVNGVIDFVVTAVVGAPSITFGTSEIEFGEGEPIPDFTATITAVSPLATLLIELIESGEPRNILENGTLIDAFDNPNNFTFDTKNYTLIESNINKTPTFVRITATDTYGKVKIALLPIKYVARPAPVVTISTSAPLAVDEYGTGYTVSGTATSESGIVEVKYLLIGSEYEVEVSKESFQTAKASYSFTGTFGGDDLRDYVTAVAVEVKDRGNKVTRQTLALTVTPKPTIVNSGDDLVALLAEQVADEKFRNIKLLLAAGATYDMAATPFALTKNLTIEGPATGAKPVITTTAKVTVVADNARIATLKFKNVEIQATGAENLISNNANAGFSIDDITVESCVLKGYKNSVIRTQAPGMTAKNITFNNCEILWENANSSFSLFHIGQNADRVGAITFTNSTVSKALYFLYCNITNSNIDVELSSSTFVNSMGTAGGYFTNIANGSCKGTMNISKVLFAGTNNVKGGYRMLRKNTIEATTTANYCTPTWKSFTDDATNGSINFVSTLPIDNAALFTNPATFDWTIKDQNSVVYKNRIGDPRWLPAQ